MPERVYSGKGGRELFLPQTVEHTDGVGNYETSSERFMILLDTSPSQFEGFA
jgi:hypothetical protein